MKLRWYGHSCFLLTNKGGNTLITDPFDSTCGYPCPTDSVDVVTMSHHHFDHACLETLTAYGKAVDTEVTNLTVSGFELSSVQAFHDEEHGAKRGKDLIFKISADGQTVVHLGDLGHYPTEAQLEFMRGADVMLIPIGGFYTIDTKTAVRIIDEVKPRAAVCMHFKTAGNTFPISDESEFVSLTGAVPAGHEKEIAELSGCCVMKYE